MSLEGDIDMVRVDGDGVERTDPVSENVSPSDRVL